MEPRDFADAFNTATPEQQRAAALLAEARRERDEARAIASEEREHIRRLRRELGETRGELDALREASRALLADLTEALARCSECEDEGRREISTWRWGCDEHAEENAQEMTYAHSLRRLRELTKEGQ